jgi:hypothetical protein
MKKIVSIVIVALMVLSITPLFGENIDVVSGATGGGGGGGSTGTPPKAPSSLSLPTSYTVLDTSVKLVWKDGSTNESGFQVERVLKGGSSWTQVASVEANGLAYTDTGLKAGSIYYYRVRAYNNYGVSAYTNELMITTAKASTTPPITVPKYNSTPSVWAIEEVEKAKAASLTVDSLLSEYNKPITRAEFSELVIKLYEKATGKVAIVVSPNPFTDTNNEAVLKAYSAGIINGVSADKFSPNANVTRQEMSVMLQRELLAVKPDGEFEVSDDYAVVFTDQSKIATWAIGAIRFMNQEGIVNGIGSGNIDPIGNATREQAIIMVYRDYTKFVVPADDSI